MAILTINGTETNWFQRYAWTAGLLFVKGRVGFGDQTGVNRFGTMASFFHLQKLTEDDLVHIYGLGLFLPACISLVDATFDIGEYNDDEIRMSKTEWKKKWGW